MESVYANIICVDEAADGLEGAECVILSVVLTSTGIPD